MNYFCTLVWSLRCRMYEGCAGLLCYSWIEPRVYEVGSILVTVNKMQGGGWRKLEPASLFSRDCFWDYAKGKCVVFCQSCCPYLLDPECWLGAVLFSSIDVGLHTFQRAACCSPCLYYLRMADIPASAGVGRTWCRKILSHESWSPCPENKAVLWTTWVFQVG